MGMPTNDRHELAKQVITALQGKGMGGMAIAEMWSVVQAVIDRAYDAGRTAGRSEKKP